MSHLPIAGTLHAAYIPNASHLTGWPRLSISVLDEAGQLLGTCSAQITASPWPFRLYLDHEGLNEDAQVTIQARCTEANEVLAEKNLTCPLRDVLNRSTHLKLDPIGDLLRSDQEDVILQDSVRIGALIRIPPQLRHAPAFLDATLLVVQDDGRSNRYASNLAEHSALIRGDRAAFAITIDPLTVPHGSSVKLNVGLYDLERKTIFAGNVIKNLDVRFSGDLDEIVLRKPRR